MKKISNKKIFVCATEQSGDNIGEKILKDLKIKYSSIVINGVGGSKMNQFMNKQYYSIKNFHSMGIIEILFSIKKYLKMINSLSDHIIKEKYDLLITIDSPDFNFPLAKKIKKIGFNGKIIHIVAPTVWAWRESRAKKFSEIFDVIFTLFDFENKYFEKYNLKSICIGHPIFYIKKSNKNMHKKNFIAFLPGSRKGEIKSLFKYFQMAYEHLSINNSNLSIFIPTLPHLKKQIQHLTKEWNINTEITTNNKEIEYFFSKSKIALVCSGTATLEIAKRQIPQLIIYKFNFLMNRENESAPFVQ